MALSIKHRGNSIHVDKCGNSWVAYNWLRITDRVSEYKVYSSGKYKAWLNGYISNYRELASKYNIHLETTCDTELLVKFLDMHNGEKLDELNGFFAVVYYDGEIKSFTDRYGIKQLYQQGDYICSEIKGLNRGAYDPNALLDWHYSLGVMTDHTIYDGIKRVDRLEFVKPKKIRIDYERAKELLRSFLIQAIDRNKTDLSTGVYLSGGIDSGIIANYLKPDYCFSVDYLDSYSEIENIKINSTGIHYTVIANNDLFNKTINNAVRALDDPKAGSCYTNYAVNELASKFCTVMYSGAGGDEVFGGYPHRNDRHISEVIKRTSAVKSSFTTPDHDEYNWRYLRAVLVVEDRMSSAFTMETRYPLLDNDFVNFALSLPEEYLSEKRILKDISGLDERILNGRKRGFCNPHLTNKQWTEQFV